MQTGAPHSAAREEEAKGLGARGRDAHGAKKKASEDELNERVPLSVARWHKHVNICLPPKGGQPRQASLREFGFSGSISTEDARNQARGRWVPQIFNWIIHVYPSETDPQNI